MLVSGLWLIEDEEPWVLLMSQAMQHGYFAGIQVQIACVPTEQSKRITSGFFHHLEESVERSECYRGKVLSLESSGGYHGTSTGMQVHRLRHVSRDDVILATRTLQLLDRNVIQFAAQAEKLASVGLARKKGLLFYGPPGTGKTHTIHYLIGALEGFTTFLISAEHIGYLGEYMKLARLLQPSLVIIEDVDLIARNRTQLDTCEEVVLNKLLNEMDGLKPEAEVIFLLTTNRPEVLEPALASRPGRIDQAVEFPLPDAACRSRLVDLYRFGLRLTPELTQSIVDRTENVSASFIKELMRRSAQFALERTGAAHALTSADVDAALDELLFAGGSLNQLLLGVQRRETDD